MKEQNEKKIKAILEVPKSCLNGIETENYFVLQVKDDFMYPYYMNGDRLLVIKQSDVNCNGDVGVVSYQNKLMLGKIEHNVDCVRLVPVNPNFKPKVFEGKQMEEFSIMGIPKMLVRDL